MTIDLHKIAQWLALAGGLMGIYFPLHSQHVGEQQARDLEKQQLQERISRDETQIEILRARIDAFERMRERGKR